MLLILWINQLNIIKWCTHKQITYKLKQMKWRFVQTWINSYSNNVKTLAVNNIAQRLLQSIRHYCMHKTKKIEKTNETTQSNNFYQSEYFHVL